MKALFFAEGGPGVGLGHLRRCGALSEALAAKGWDCRFLAAEPAVKSWLTAHGRRLEPSRSPVSGRLPDADYSCDVFVADSYPLENSELLAKVRARARLIAAFDDHFNRHEAADVILSTGVRAPKLSWPARGRLEHLLGPAYHPLPSEYLPIIPRKLGQDLKKVLVTVGGSGRPEVLAKILSAVRAEIPSAEVDCLIGPFADQNDRAAFAAVRWHKDPPSVKSHYLACDLAVAGSGQTLFELAATGTPAVAVGLAENQRENLLGMQEAGTVLSAGCADDPDFTKNLAKALARAREFDVRQGLSQSGQRLIDGKGGERVAEAFAKLLESRKVAP